MYPGEFSHDVGMVGDSVFSEQFRRKPVMEGFDGSVFELEVGIADYHPSTPPYAVRAGRHFMSTTYEFHDTGAGFSRGKRTHDTPNALIG